MLFARDREVARIRKANKAATMGRLLLGEISSWTEFAQADEEELRSLPRRSLRAGVSDVEQRLVQAIKQFRNRNFSNMSEETLALLYDTVKEHEGLEMPLAEFETQYARIRREVLRGAPEHATVVISLWGLQFKYPEDYLAKDVAQAIEWAKTADEQLRSLRGMAHACLRAERDRIALLVRQKDCASRTCLICCFNLLEAYLNGIAWSFARSATSPDSLSENKRRLIENPGDASLRDKLMKYPEIIAGTALWKSNDQNPRDLLNILKPFRDSLVHPSPFAAPERFGGYEKLRLFYRISFDTAILTARLTCDAIVAIHQHLNPTSNANPEWLAELIHKIEECEQEPPIG